MQQKSAPESGSKYLFEEEFHHEKIGNHDVSKETVTSLRTDLSRFYRLERKLQSINRANGGENPQKAAERLNGMLRKSGIGGVNGGSESKAYFMANGKEVVLVANTVAEGKEINSRTAVLDAFSKIEGMLFDPFSEDLRTAEDDLRKINLEYGNEANDAKRVLDFAANTSGSVAKILGFKGWEGGDASFERRVETIKQRHAKMASLFQKYYVDTVASIGPDRIKAGTITEQERRDLSILEFQKKRYEAVTGAKLEVPESFVGYVLTEPSSLKHAGYAVAGIGWGAVKAVYESAKFVVWDIPKFLGSYAFSEKFRTDVNDALSLAAHSISQYSEGKNAKQMVADLFSMVAGEIKKQYAEIQKLPPEEQAFKIGEIVGNVLLILAGPKLAKDFLKSSALRVKSNFEAVKGLQKLGKVFEIKSVRTWDDLESFATTVQKIRGRKDLWGDELRAIIKGIRSGDPAFSPNMLPKSGGFREYANALVKDGGYLSQKTVNKLGTNWADAIVEETKSAYRKTSEILNKISPERFPSELKEAGNEFKRIRKFHNYLDDKVVDVRESLSRIHKEIVAAKFSDAMVSVSKLKNDLGAYLSGLVAAGEGGSEAASATRAMLAKIPGYENAVTVLSDGVETARHGVSEVMEGASSRAKAVLEVGEKAMDKTKELYSDAEAGIARLRNRLPASVRKGLAFDYGFAAYKNEAGKFNFVKTDGRFLLDSKGKPLEFLHASQFSKNGAVVCDTATGKFGLIGREGEFIMRPKFDMIQELSSERMIVSKNAEYFVMKRGPGGKRFVKAGGPYDFITEPHQGRAIAVKKQPDGSEIRTLISDGIEDSSVQKGKKRSANQLRELTIHGRVENKYYAYVDDFADDGIAAAQLPELSASGKPQWHVIDRSGSAMNIKGQNKGALKIIADNPAEALNRYRELQFEYSNVRDVAKIDRARATILKKHPDLAASDVHIVETDVEGVFRIQKETPNGFLKGYVNVKHDIVVEPKFEDVFYSDAKQGYLRVKQNGKWGIIDSKSKTGEFLIDPSKHDYASIQVNNERHNLFEVQVDRLTGRSNATMFNEQKVGLVSLNGKVLIEPKYAYIENPRDGLYRGVEFSARDSSVSAQASYFDISSAAEGTGIGSGAKGAGQDALSRTADAAIRGNDYRAKVTGIEKTIDPLRRTLDSVTVGKFLASSPDIFGAGKLPFPEYLRHHAPAGVTSKRQLMELFEKYSKERFLDFVSNFSEVEHRNLGRIDLMRIRQRMQSDMKSEFEGQFRLVLAGQADRADEAVRASLASYFERSGPLEQNWSIINNRKVIKAAA